MKSIAHNVDLLHFFAADLAPVRILPTIQTAFDFQPFGRRRLRDQVNDGFIINQRLPSPIEGDEREQTMLDLVPFAGTGSKMTDRNSEPRLIGELLQLQLPKPQA